MHKTVVLDGEVSLVSCLDGDCSLEIPESGELGIVTSIGGARPPYTGETTVTPSDVTQVLYTADMTVLENITINPIPNNYGLIGWNGSVLTVS